MPDVRWPTDERREGMDVVAAPRVLTVVFVNRRRTQDAIAYENSFLPYSYRTVQIELTEEQRRALTPRPVAFSGREAADYEQIYDVWFEPVEDDADA